LLGICLLCIITGLLIPLRQHREQIQFWKQRGDDYKAASDAQDARNDLMLEYLQKLLPLAETADRILRSFPVTKGGGDS
jgi:hypothetical protein